MTKDEFIAKLQETLQTEYELKPDMLLEEIPEWDSLSKLEVQMLLEEHNAHITFPELDTLKSINDIIKYVIKE